MKGAVPVVDLPCAQVEQVCWPVEEVYVPVGHAVQVSFSAELE